MSFSDNKLEGGTSGLNISEIERALNAFSGTRTSFFNSPKGETVMEDVENSEQTSRTRKLTTQENTVGNIWPSVVDFGRTFASELPEKRSGIVFLNTASRGTSSTFADQHHSEISFNNVEKEIDSPQVFLKRPRCLEVIYKNSCRAEKFSPLPKPSPPKPKKAESCIPVNGLAVDEPSMAVKHSCYGLIGSTIEEQLEEERIEETCPPQSNELPLNGSVISTGFWNPLCVQMVIMFIPLVFFILLFVTQYSVISSSFSKSSLKIGSLLGNLTIALGKEQAYASVICAITTRVATSNDLQEFHLQLNGYRATYLELQKSVDDLVAQIEVEVNFNKEQFKTRLGSLLDTNIASMSQLSNARVRALNSPLDWDLMMRYDFIIQDVLIYRGLFIFEDSIQKVNEAQQTNNLFASTSYYLCEAMILYMTQLGVGVAMPAPRTREEVDFIQFNVGAFRLMERTYLYPSSPTMLKEFELVVNNTANILTVRLPPDVGPAIIRMLTITYKDPQIIVEDLPAGEKALENLWNVVSVVESTMAPLQQRIDKYMSVDDTLALVWIMMCVVICGAGLLLYIVAIFTHHMYIYRLKACNRSALEMRAAFTRMHEAFLRIAHLQMDEMNVDAMHLEMKRNALSQDKSKGQYFSSERGIYKTSQLVRSLEPFLPLPMVHPPSGVPEEALAHRSSLVRPYLLHCDTMVGIRLDFSILSNSSRDAAVILAQSYSVIENPGEASMGSKSGSVMDMDSFMGGNRSFRKEQKRQMRSKKKEQLYFTQTTRILEFLCSATEMHLPPGSMDGFLSQCGEDAVMWINLRNELPAPCLVAFSIAISVVEFCKQKSLECPSIVLCSGPGVMGNISSLSSAELAEGVDDVELMGDHGVVEGDSLELFSSDSDTEIVNAENVSEWKDFVSATEGMVLKKRLRWWVRQLLGLHTDEEVLKDVHSTDSKGFANEKMSPETFTENTNHAGRKREGHTAFSVYGQVVRDMDAALDVARCHGQLLLANEDFIRNVLLDKEKLPEMLRLLHATHISKEDRSGRNDVSNQSTHSETSNGSISEANDESSRNGDGSQSRVFKLGEKKIVLAASQHIEEFLPLITPLEIVELHRHASVMRTTRILTNKEKRQLRKKQKEAKGGYLDSEEPMREDGSGEVPSLVMEDEYEPIEGFTPFNRIIPSGSPHSISAEDHVTTFNTVCELNTFYGIGLMRGDRSLGGSVSRTVASFSTFSRLTDSAKVIEEWKKIMNEYAAFCYEVEMVSPLDARENPIHAGVAASIKERGISLENSFIEFGVANASSTLTTFSAAHLIDIIRSVTGLYDESVPLSPAWEHINPLSIQSLRLYRIFTASEGNS